MTNCNACKKPVRQSEKIICSRTSCARPYHLVCVGLSSDAVRKSNAWSCPLCVGKQPRGDNTNTPIRGSELTPIADADESSYVTTRKPNLPKASQSEECTADLQSDILCSLRSELSVLIRNAVKSELCTMKSQISTIESTVNYISAQYDELLKSLKATNAEIKSLKDENSRLRTDMQACVIRVQHLEEENARQQQWSRLQNIEVAGVPESKDENAVDIIIKLAKKIGIPIESSDVEFAHRVQARQPNTTTRGRSIIARFRQRHTKDMIVAASRKHRGIKPSDIGLGSEVRSDSIIYFNEHLTKNNRLLLKETKTKAREANFKFTWTKNCRIYVRRNETSPPIPIITAADLLKLG